MASGMMHIRPLTTLEECRTVAELEKTVWAYADGDDIVPPPVLIVSIKRGGVLLGSFGDDGRMNGFVYSIPALKNGRLSQWSHMLGVTPDARAAGVGTALKLAQREATLAMGIDLIEWTYDPLQAMNAHLNFAKLGVVVEEYEENIYGDSSSPLHRGTPTDRFVAEWKLQEPHVLRRIASDARLAVKDRGVADAPVVNPSAPAGKGLAPGQHDLERKDRRLRVEIPMGFGEMQREDPALALRWRLATRRIFQTYLARGYRVVDFFLARGEGRGWYLLAMPEERQDRQPIPPPG